MLGPDFDAKDMEDIFKGIVDNNDKNKVRKVKMRIFTLTLQFVFFYIQSKLQAYMS